MFGTPFSKARSLKIQTLMFTMFADASDIDDMNVPGVLVKRPAKDDLALVLQEVQAFDLETKTKKRRLERKHTSTVGEVSNLTQVWCFYYFRLVCHS